MNGDDSPVLLYAHPSMESLAKEIVDRCFSLKQHRDSKTKLKPSVCIYTSTL